MADYYPLIARAIAGLDPNAPGESRRALYERARAALIAQLRSVQPPLSESEITRERLSLEEAVRKVEAEAAQRARDAQRASGGAARPGDALRRAGARNPEAPATPAAQPGATSDPAAAPAPRPRPAAAPPAPRNERPPLGAEPAEARPARSPRPAEPPPAAAAPATPPRPQPAQAAAPDAPQLRERPAAPRRGQDNNIPAASTPSMRGFRDITADVDDLGKATAQANRAARKTYANVPATDLDRLEDDDDRPPLPEAPYSYDESVQEAERYSVPATSTRPRAAAEREAKKKPERSGSTFPFKAAIAAGIVLILIGAGILWGRPLVGAVTGLFKSSSTVEAPKDTGAPLSKPKITDRVGQSPSSDQIAPVAQKVVLYDEDPADPKGKQYLGSVVWRTEQIKATGTQKADIAVRADIDIPDRKFKMTMSFRRNTDTSLPASHTAELTFILPQDFTGGGVGNVPGILMKSNEQARGTPLAGLAVKVTDGFFLVGLSNVDADRTRNVQLLKERSWFDVPLVYSNQRRAIIAIEKGAPGERAFNDAFAVWGD
ncbi:hypothetical protein SSBR45G_59930 [Bradyrhizobium sp. SSBR45G]|uniref:hypothetical protein n=1 Tax=unclassified Bradyrhizobium TaxID=2631580 RepID=UPI002342A498|nr:MULTISPECIES: hypothetical protein [unclassified Bradyrhizobium]GLH81084.1 hypothetical protein SSBR45G_59930 [Bradyrhizobium sp. SSBR45G]GLH88543.1 hypothetical protein SSBR45R_60040 [Bradyrhizobium sp. SSBR45R]